MQKNKIIAVWGNPNSGKTTFSIKMAVDLSRNKKNVILILCDSMTPTVSTILPFQETKDQSFGELLSSIQVTQESILKKCIPVGRNDYLTVIGYLHGENERTYAKYSKERVVDLLILLKHLADHIIIDCSSNISNDIFSRTALELSDQVIRLITPDLKAISYYDSNLPSLSERKYNLQSHIKVLSNVKPEVPKDTVANKFGGIVFELKYQEEIERQWWEGLLFETLQQKKSQSYKKTLLEIQRTIIAVEEKKEKSKSPSKIEKAKSPKPSNKISEFFKKRGVKNE